MLLFERLMVSHARSISLFIRRIKLNNQKNSFFLLNLFPAFFPLLQLASAAGRARRHDSL